MAPTPVEAEDDVIALRRGLWLGAVVALIAVSLFWMAPLWAVLLGSLKSAQDFVSSGPFDFPTSIDWTNFAWAFGPIDLPTKIGNSILISGGATLLSLIIALPLSFAVGIGNHWTRRIVMVACILIFLLPLEALAFPTYLLSKMLGQYGNPAFVTIPLGIVGSAFATFLLTHVMRRFPAEVRDAAEVDGATHWQIFRRVVLPMMIPTIATVSLLLFVTNWNEYLITLLLLPDSSTQTVPLAISAVNYGQFGGAPPPAMAAIGLLGVVPSLLVFFAFQGALVRGISAGTVSN